MPLQPNSVIDGRYRVEALLGEGAMAEVYRVIHTQLGTMHALKVLRLDGENIYERFMREGQVQAKLRHPNIVAVSDIVKIGDDPGLVMEYVDGSSLDLLLSERKLTLEQVDHLARGIIKGVAAAHDSGLIHRDLKPANILLQLEGKKLTPKITDFGLAKAVDSSTNWNSTKSGVMMGTPAYMAPEQILDAKRVDARADVFSLGAILFHMVTGRRPFDQRTVADTLGAVLDGDRPSVRALVPDLPAFRVDAIERALETDRENRVPDCRQLYSMWTGEFQMGSLQEHVPFDSEVFKRLSDVGKGKALEPIDPDGETVPTVRPDPNAATVVHRPDDSTEELPKRLADLAPHAPQPVGARSSGKISRAGLPQGARSSGKISRAGLPQGARSSGKISRAGLPEGARSSGDISRAELPQGARSGKISRAGLQNPARSSGNISRAGLPSPPSEPRPERTRLFVLAAFVVISILVLSLIGGILSGTLTALLLR